MKTLPALRIVVLVLVAGTVGWFAARHWPGHEAGGAGPDGTGRRVSYYQCSMHPQIKSDRPGRCTICGMELSAILEGARGFDPGEGLVLLPSNSVQVVNVQTELASRRVLQRAFRFAGVIEDNDSRHRFVSALTDGRVDRLFVNYVGAEVRSGQPLAALYSPALLAAERDYLVLLESQRRGDAPALILERARMLEAATVRLKRLGLSDAQIAKLPGKDPGDSHSEIEVPISGTVVARNVYEGQYVKEGDKLFEIADFSTMWFLFDAYEADLAWLSPGQKVTVTTPAVPGKTFSGVISFIDPSVRDATRSAKVRVELSNPLLIDGGRERRELYHKLYAEAVVEVEVPEVLAVARTAVLSAGSSPLVYVDRGGGAYEQRRVNVGRSGDRDWEILGGLRAGERVVTSGNLVIDAQAQLNTGMPALAAPESTVAGEVGAGTAAARLEPAAVQAAGAFLAAASAVAEALAADRLGEFNARTPALNEAVRALSRAIGTRKAWAAPMERVASAAHFEPAPDLPAARKAFVPFGLAASDLAILLRRQAEFSQIKIYQCPMLKRVVAGGPAVGRWVQAMEPLRNPFFGAEMLDCGEEVKP